MIDPVLCLLGGLSKQRTEAARINAGAMDNNHKLEIIAKPFMRKIDRHPITTAEERKKQLYSAP